MDQRSSEESVSTWPCAKPVHTGGVAVVAPGPFDPQLEAGTAFRLAGTNTVASVYLKESNVMPSSVAVDTSVFVARDVIVPVEPVKYEYRLFRSGENPIAPISVENLSFSAAYAFCAVNIALVFAFASLCFERA